MTRIAILETGAPPAPLCDRFGDYPSMLAKMLGPGFDVEVFDVQAGGLPVAADFDGAMITGSPAGVYDGDPWIGDLLDWIRDARGRTRLVGICFGHQAMAQALGGQVEKSGRGWGVGLHTYRVMSVEPWMGAGPPTIAIPVSHQDQVVTLPPEARVILRSDFTPYAGLAWEDTAVSFQCHPEFAPAYAAALVEARRGSRLSEDLADTAIASLEQPNNRALLGSSIARFLAGDYSMTSPAS